MRIEALNALIGDDTHMFKIPPDLPLQREEDFRSHKGRRITSPFEKNGAGGFL